MVNLATIRAPARAPFPFERKLQAGGEALHDCIISDTFAKHNLRRAATLSKMAIFGGVSQDRQDYFLTSPSFSLTYGAAVVGDEAGLIRLRTRSNASRLAASNAVGIMKVANFRGLGLAPT